MRMPSVVSSMLAYGSAPTSTSVAGASTPSFMRSTSDVPPAMKAAPPARPASSAAASFGARKYRKGCMLRDLLPRALNRRHDVRVGGAAAEVAAHLLAHLGVGGGAPLGQQRHRAHDLARRAVAALERVLGDEGGLHGMQRLAAGQPLDGRDGRALRHDRQRQAGVHAAAADQNRAGAALPVVAALLGAGETQALAQGI